MFVAPIVLLALTSTGCEEALKPVAAALQRDERANVTAMLDAIRAQCSDSGSFHELVGVASGLSGNLTVAAEEFHQAITLNPQLSNDPTVVLWFCRALIETNQSARLIAFLASHQRGLSPPLLFSLATLFARHRDYRQAIKYFREIPTGVADDAVYFNIGLAYSHLREFENARKYYFRAIDKHPGHVEAYLRVGLDFAASGDRRKAVPWLLRAREFAPARPDIAYTLTEQLLSLEYFETARQIMAEALTANPRDPLLLVANGDLMLVQGKQSEAVDSYQSALAIETKLPSALIGLARVEALKGNTGEARQKLVLALSIEPENPAVNGELGSLELQEGNWSDAYLHLEKAWSLEQSNPMIAVQLARALQHLNRPIDALHTLQPLTLTLGDSPAFHFELVQIYALLGKTAEAQAQRDMVASLRAQSDNSLHFEDPKTYVH